MSSAEKIQQQTESTQQRKARELKMVTVKVYALEAGARAARVWFRQADPKPYTFEVMLRELPTAKTWRVDSVVAPDGLNHFARDGELGSLRRAILGELPCALEQELMKFKRFEAIEADQIQIGQQVLFDSLMKN